MSKKTQQMTTLQVSIIKNLPKSKEGCLTAIGLMAIGDVLIGQHTIHQVRAALGYLRQMKIIDGNRWGQHICYHRP